jgi:hypothetical protein
MLGAPEIQAEPSEIDQNLESLFDEGSGPDKRQ